MGYRMGRRKTHSKEDVLEKAMHLFRENGFAGTSADMLVERTGVSRYSLYADFGSLQGLFDEALELYNDELIDASIGPMERPDAGLTEIVALLDFYGSAGSGPAAGLGCLLCNTAVEFGANDPSGNAAVHRYFKRLSAAFRNALNNAQKDGHLLPNIDLQKEADFMTSVILGAFVMIRAKAAPEVIKNAADAAKERISSISVDRIH